MKARVKNGRLVLDEPTTLPEGTELELVIDDGGDDLNDEDRAALHASLQRGIESARAGNSRPASELIDELRRRQ